MNIKLFNVALGIVLTATTMSASAQKVYTEGVITLNTTMRGQEVQPKMYFRADSTAMAITMGPANVMVLMDAKGTFLAVTVNVPVASLKKAGVASPSELEAAMDAFPKFTFTPTTETKVISGFNCKKVIATESKTSKKYDIWVTNDISVPDIAVAKYYAGIGGVPIKYTSFSQGQEADVTLLSITAQKVPSGIFSIPKDFPRGTMEELNSQ